MTRPVSEFDPCWPHGFVTREGHPVTVYTMAASGHWSIHGYIEGCTGPSCWNSSGIYSINGPSECDLVNAPDPNAVKPIFEERWMNVREDGEVEVFAYRNEKHCLASRPMGCRRAVVPCLLIERAAMTAITHDGKAGYFVEVPR